MSANRTQWIGVGLVVLSIGGFVAWGTRSAGTPGATRLKSGTTTRCPRRRNRRRKPRAISRSPEGTG